VRVCVCARVFVLVCVRARVFVLVCACICMVVSVCERDIDTNTERAGACMHERVGPNVCVRTLWC
jgi:hypothetical protein